MDTLQTLTPHVKNLGGGFVVRRSLPSVQRQAVGPFLFFDHFGPLTVEPGTNHDVRPHPHIGLATVTYLFEGAIAHRDSTGVVQRIEPGAINWMTAGRGIVHSERMPDDLRDQAHVRHGLQLWAAVPADREEDAPAFSHTPAEAIPTLDHEGATVRVLIGDAFGQRSPVPTVSPTLYLDLQLPADAPVSLPALATEMALYSVDQPFTVDGRPVPPHTLAVLPHRRAARLQADNGARLVLVGGEPLGPRFVWWNFVSSRKERIVQAADDWAAGRFDAVPGETEFIPLPERRPS